ncbi:GNAT family N-acetyltransferase [Chitinophaga sp. CF418]|uniref:GNAT family N-acetyltransferase n=1 Tax=Chitinophaga sp. CF418 TaxID=1855287 RepID=UPI0009197480|nr:GNAT family N-acetyltransferase [Chitinophaga sp. CF418]SHL89336.1 Predicted acetyltransferase, GNAT superfamily [Chitinophaga sp. CF418]
MQIVKAQTPEDIELAREAILQFRPNVDPLTLVAQVQQMMRDESFELVHILTEDGKKAAAFTGFRTIHHLMTGKIIYIDDLFTLPEYRGHGYAGALLDYVHNQAKERGIENVHLDSGYALHPAHRLYLSKGYVMACHHLARKTQA